MQIKKLHYLSGIVIFIFVCIHLLNHTWSLFGADEHIALMNSLRKFYRNVFFESTLLIAIFIQVVSGLKLFWLKRRSVADWFDKVQLYSGLYLALFFLIHLSAVFGGRLILNLDTNFYFGVAGLNTFPFNLFFVPYYALAIFSFFIHIAVIHNKKMKIKVLGLTPKMQSITIIIFGVFLIFLIFYGLTNKFTGVIIPEEYGVLIGK